MTAASIPRDDTRLWVVALLVSLVLNLLILVVLAWMTLQSLWLRAELPRDQPVEEEVTVTFLPPREATPPPAVEKSRAFVRTSDEQLAPPAEDPDFIGERNTRAAAELPPDAEAPDALPSQEGIEPRIEGEVETTVSDYQDGSLEHRDPGQEQPPSEAVVATPAEEQPAESEASGTEEELPERRDPAKPREQLAETPWQVDRPAEEDPVDDKPKPSPEPEREVAEESESERPKPPSPAPREPGFRGHQRKTQLRGSISRRGTSSLDVEDTDLGRYHAALSRAIERAWQRQVVRNRDYITPGVIRVRVVLDPRGRVRSVGAVEEFGIGVIQKGFTFRAIREADLPPMPAELRRELDGEPLELLYNFIF